MFHSFYFLNNLHFYSGERVILRVREFVITGHCLLTLYIIKILLWLTTKLMPRPHGLFPAQWHLSEDLLFPKLQKLHMQQKLLVYWPNRLDYVYCGDGDSLIRVLDCQHRRWARSGA